MLHSWPIYHVILKFSIFLSRSPCVAKFRRGIALDSSLSLIGAAANRRKLLGNLSPIAQEFRCFAHTAYFVPEKSHHGLHRSFSRSADAIFIYICSFNYYYSLCLALYTTLSCKGPLCFMSLWYPIICDVVYVLS